MDTFLSEKNQHPRDKRIVFHEDTHIYEVDGSSDGIMSVTTFIHHYFPSFNADAVLKKMRNKEEKYPNMTDEEIKRQWSENGKKASQEGTGMHRMIELYYNGVEPEEKSKEFTYFLDFHNKEIASRGLMPYRTEWSIFDGEIEIAGQLDMLYQKHDGTYGLYDWKRVKEIKRSNPYEKGLGPLRMVEHCNYNHYSLQLNIYKKILQTCYGINVTEMNLVILHPENEGYVMIPVGDEMEKNVDTIFSHRKREVSQLYKS